MIDKLTAGDTINFLTAGGDYPASSGWSLVYKLLPRSAGPDAISLDSVADGDDHRVQVASDVTASWTPGIYGWVCYAVKPGERQTLETGSVQVLPDPGAVSVLDTRTSAQIALDNITATLEGRATSAIAEYSIAGRSLKHIPIGELITMQSHLRLQVANETAATAVAKGLPNPRRVLVRFGR
jgi:hypothetical protein